MPTLCVNVIASKVQEGGLGAVRQSCFCILTLCVLLFCLSATPVSADRKALNVHQAQAVFLYKIISFIYWPDAAFETQESPFVIGVIGKDPFGHLLDAVVAGRKIRNRPIVVRRYGSQDGLDRNTHLLFVADSSLAELDSIIREIDRANWRTIIIVPGESVERGGVCISIQTTGGKLSFDVNIDSLRDRDVKMGASLLRLARKIHGAP